MEFERVVIPLFSNSPISATDHYDGSKPELAFFAGIILGIGPRKLTMCKGSYFHCTFCSWLHSLLPNKRCANFREKRIGHDRP